MHNIFDCYQLAPKWNIFVLPEIKSKQTYEKDFFEIYDKMKRYLHWRNLVSNLLFSETGTSIVSKFLDLSVSRRG